MTVNFFRSFFKTASTVNERRICTIMGVMQLSASKAPLLILHATVRSNLRCSLLLRNSKACCGALYLEHIMRSHARAGAKGDAILRGGQRKGSKLDLKNTHAVDSNLSQRVE